MACGSQGERKEFIRGFVTQVVKSEDQALIRYRLPDGKPAPQKEVLDTDLFGGVNVTSAPLAARFVADSGGFSFLGLIAGPRRRSPPNLQVTFAEDRSSDG